ncbi:hypothetical protein EK904_006371 [Melospiza melodia maxima]|nr:hypothetical protein EK904_006371 [Melospiza melodia maxima]
MACCIFFLFLSKWMIEIPGTLLKAAVLSLIVVYSFMLKEGAVSSWCCSDVKDLVKMLKDNVVGVDDWMRRIAAPVDTHSSPSAFPIPPRRGSEARKLLPQNRILWVKGRWDKFLEDRQERIIAKYIKASAAGSWEGSVLEEAVRDCEVQCTCP